MFLSLRRSTFGSGLRPGLPRSSSTSHPFLRRISLLCSSLALLSGALACGGGGGGGGGGTTQPAAGKALVRFVHASPDTPAALFYPQGDVATPLSSALSFGTASAYLELPAGRQAIDMRLQDDGVVGEPILDGAIVSFEAGQKYSIVLAGQVRAEDADSALRLVRVQEAYLAAPPGQSQFVFVHALADAESLVLDTAPLGSDDLTLSRFTHSGAAGLSVTPAAMSWRSAGGVSTSFTNPEATPAGEQGLIVVTGLEKGHPVAVEGPKAGMQLLVVPTDTSRPLQRVRQDPRVFAFHAALPSTNLYDLFVDLDGDGSCESELFDALSAADPGALPSAQLPKGVRAFEVFVHQAGSQRPASAPLLRQEITLAEGQRSLLALSGFQTPAAGQVGLSLNAYTDALATDDNLQARVRFIHSAPTLGALQVGPAAGSALAAFWFSAIPYRGASDESGRATAPLTTATRLGLSASPASSPLLASFDLPANAALAATRSFWLVYGAPPSLRLARIALPVDLSSPARSPWTWSRLP